MTHGSGRPPEAPPEGGARWQAWRELIVLGATLAAFLASLWLLRRPAPAPILILPPPTPVPTRTPTPVWIQVYVTGAVQAPGLYTVPQGIRVATLLEEAGGPLPTADLEALNLAAPVADGMHLHVPTRGESPRPTPSSRLDLNTATVEELDRLPGIGPRTAQAIVDYRLKHGPFRRLEDLLNVPGVGPATLERIRPLVTVGEGGP